MLHAQKNVWEFGSFRIDREQGVLLSAGEVVPLAPKVFDTLLALVESSGRVIEKEELLKTIWPDTFVEEGSLARNVSTLRKALGDGQDDQRYIQTIPKHGYRFIAPVHAIPQNEMESAASLPAGAVPVRGRSAWWSPKAAAATLGILALVSLGLWLAFRQGSVVAAQPRIRTIAVLPLENLSRDPDQEYFSDGITDALISSLSQIHSIGVISRTSVMRYKGTTKPLPDIGRELGADAIVEGSVQRSGGHMRITAQLIRTSTDKHLWANEYERNATDVLTLEAEVARAIAQEIQAQVTPQEAGRLAGPRKVVPEAQDAYLLGRFHLGKTTEADRTKAIEYFTRAIQLQPDYAAAYAGLAEGLRDARSRGLVTKALELDPNLAEAHAALAALHMHDLDWAGADREFRRALELKPTSLEIAICYTCLLAEMGRIPEALALAERTVATDPTSSEAQRSYGSALMAARRFDTALFRFQRAVELDPENQAALFSICQIYLLQGKFPEALATLDRPQFHPSALLAYVYAMMGRRAEALKMVQAVTKPGSPPDNRNVAMAYFALGNKDRGFRILEKAFDDREPLIYWLKVSPTYDSIRSDPRFQALLARLKIPD